MDKQTGDLEIITFSSPRSLRDWLAKKHDKSPGFWLQIFKKDAKVESITYAEALDQALCFGWIDGQKKAHDTESWLQKFTPRRARSSWSKRNTEHAERLIKSRQMTAAGLTEVNSAKQDGRWEAAYDAFGSAAPPEDFLQALAKNKKASAFFKSLNKTNLYSIVYRLQTAKKPETRLKRIEMIVMMLERGETFH